MLYTVANLDKEKIEALQSLEKTLGKTLIAFSGKDLGVSALNDNELSQIREAEKKLGITLVAVK